MIYAIAYDLGTSAVKTCLFKIDESIEMIASASSENHLYILDNGGAEQDAEEWWQGMRKTTKEVLEKAELPPERIAGISFCSQMQGLVLVDKEGNALRRPMSYMDQRSGAEMKAVQGHGITVSGVNIFTLVKSLYITHAASTSVKDPLWKYKWVEKNEPEIFERVYKWLDVKEYIICRCTGNFIMTKDSAYATFLYDPKNECWSKTLCNTYGVRPEHLPEIVNCTDQVGLLTKKAAADLGLIEGLPVYGGGGDATLIGLGAGCTKVGETHIYSGTSGWVSTIIDKPAVDIKCMIAGVVAAEKGKYNYFAEMETASKCFEWVKDHIALDEIGIYLKKQNITEDHERIYESLYDYLSETIKGAAPGSGGVLFTPWLHGNRCPFEDPKAAGMFFNIKLETGKTELIRAVLEGICFHLRWMLECQDKKIRTSQSIRFVGGGALSKVSCQILADVTGRRIETVPLTKDIGAVGAVMLVMVGKGLAKNLEDVGKLIKVQDVYEPNLSHKEIYDKNYSVFKTLYKTNKKSFAILNG
ncbi:MAG: xylulokinase [Anaerovoracaceae bacterium]